MEAGPSQATFAQRTALAFLLDGLEFAIDLRQVREVARCAKVTRIPGTSQSVRGVVNVRGRVIPVVDLRALLALGATPATRATCLIVAEVVVSAEPSPIAFLVDAVTRVIDTPGDEILPPPAFGTRWPASALSGVARVGDGMVNVLDVERVLGEGGMVRGLAVTGERNS